MTLGGNTSFVSNAGDTLKINGAINGTNSLTITGAGNVDLQNSNIGLTTKLVSCDPTISYCCNT